MSATTENMHHGSSDHEHMIKKEMGDRNHHHGHNGSQHNGGMSNSHSSMMMRSENSSDKHPLHQYDLSIMSRLYESCLSKAAEQGMVAANWRPEDWANERHERRHDWSSPIVVGHKQRVYDAFARMARESAEPMILMPNFDFGDMINFERFLDALKVDGINAIGRYKQYLNSREIRKLEIDLVVIHPVHGIMLIETKETDMFDNKKRSRARMHLNAARQSFEAVLRLILEANGLKPSEVQMPVYQFVALPNVREMPVKSSMQKGQSGQSPSSSGVENNAANTSSSSIGSMSSPSSSSSSMRPSRALNYLIKSDLDDQNEFAKWWKRSVEEPSRLLAEAKREEEEKEREKRANEEKKEGEEKKERKEEREKKMMSKKDLVNQMMGLMACVRNNSLMPVVYPEMENGMMMSMMSEREMKEEKDNKEESKDEMDGKLHLNQPAMNIYAEFMRPEHERARALSKCVVLSRDSEKIRRTICLQAMWLLLNDSQKKISVVTSEANRPYYEEFFARQRKVYNNLNNLRFYTDIHSCDPSQHTLKRDGEIWFFDAGVTMKTDSGVNQASLNDILTRVKDLPSYWIFSEHHDQVGHHQHELNSMNVKHVDLDEQRHHHEHHRQMDMSQMRIKLPMRLQCDLLIVGDLIGPMQLKYLYKHLKSSSVLNQTQAYQREGQRDGQHQQQQQHQYVQLKFNPVKRFRSVKFIRGGTIENVRNALKMHDSIQAPVVFMHVGDEDLFKNRQSMTTIERIKELGTLMREYCPKSFIALSSLMRRQSRTENGVINEVNKGMTNFCKQTKDSLNCFYMLNNHFEPDYHTQSGRMLTGKGLKLFADNMLFTVDYFLIRNNKQH